MSDEKKMMSMQIENRKFEPVDEFKKNAHLKSWDEYKKMYDYSINEPEKFWAEQADVLEWESKEFTDVMKFDFVEGNIRFYDGGKLNLSKSCLEKNLNNGNKDKVAFIWQGEEEDDVKKMTYQQMYDQTNKFANVLKDLGVKKGDRVTIYLPMILELPIAMLACARIGAVHNVIFGGFSPDSIADRVTDSSCEYVITADGGRRSGKKIDLKGNVDKAMERCPTVKNVIVFKHTGVDVQWSDKDLWWHDLMDKAADFCEPEIMNSEDPLFILYTSGSTGKPKGVMHTTAGYGVYTSMTHKYIFDYHQEDTYWCTADIGWVTGHSYIVYGPMINGATSVMFEGVPTYPGPDRFWQIVEKFKVAQFYTAPTALRAIMRFGDDHVNKHDVSSLKLLGTVGEPINPEAWMWYHEVVGKEKCPIVDTWWQTETGGILITPLPGFVATKPGSATIPFFGVKPMIIRENREECDTNEGGYLTIDRAWPGMMRTVYGDHARFVSTYFSQYPGLYFTGDGARRDEDGYYWLMGRVDDVLNVSGHRMGTAEVESALVSHKNVAEAAVVGMPHEIKGEGIYAYVTLNEGIEATPELKKILVAHVSNEIGPIAKPDYVHFTNALPKTRSGKIMRRILRKIAKKETDDLGDVTTLADPSVVTALVEGSYK